MSPPVRPPAATLHLEALVALARSVCGRPLPDPVVRPLGAGRSNLTYLLTARDGTRLVVRRPPAAVGSGPAHDVEREARVMAALAATRVPVPRVLAVTRAPQIAGGVPVVLLEHCSGEVLDLAAIGSLTPAGRARLGDEVARTLAAVHAVAVDDVGLGDLSSRSPFALRQLRRWSRQLAAMPGGPWPGLHALEEALRSCVPDSDEITLVHGDFGLANLLVRPRDGTVSAVLDWELSTLGHPLADLGVLLAYWGDRDGPLVDGSPAGAVDGCLDGAALAQAYARASGRRLDALPFWRALALWKLAVVGRDVLRRGAAPDPVAGERAVSRLVDEAWTVLAG